MRMKLKLVTLFDVVSVDTESCTRRELRDVSCGDRGRAE